MIIALAETDLLVVNEWKPVKLIREKSFDNINKYFFSKLPRFEE